MARHIGQGWAFPPHLDDRNRVMMVSGDVDLRQSIFIILNTVPGERVMRPDFGCRIHELLFAPANEYTAAVAERYITEALKRWEPRMDLRRVRVTPGRQEYGELLIDIVYAIKGSSDERDLIYPYYLIPED